MNVRSLEHPEGGDVLLVSFDAKRERKFEDKEAEFKYFTGEVGEWAEGHREASSEWIEPKHIYVLNDEYGSHNVAWVYRAGTDFQTGEAWHLHHVVCDCAPSLEAENREDEMFSCRSLQKVLRLRAQQKNQEYALGTVLGEFRHFDEKTGSFNLTVVGEELALRSIAYILQIDKNAPEEWPANKVSGRHEVSQLVSILQEGEENVVDLLERMQVAGIVQFDGEVVRLAA